MARPIKATPILTKASDIKRLLDTINHPRKVTKDELEKRKKAFDFFESIKQF